MTDPLITAASIDDPSASTIEGLRAVSENSQRSLIQERSASLEPLEGHSHIDFQPEQVKQDPGQGPPSASEPCEDFRPTQIMEAKRSRVGDHNVKRVPPIADKGKHVEDNVPGHPPRRRSTADTAITTRTQDSETFAETAIWDQKTILALDGGGIRGYSALLIIRKLMEAIVRFETDHDDGPADSSYHPLQPPKRRAEGRLPNNYTVAKDTKTKSLLRRLTGSVSPTTHIGTEDVPTKLAPWLPCHYFDYMAGTSTGGLIAIMLGRLRMNIDDCISEYETLGEKVFGHSRYFHLRSPLFWPRDKYSAEALHNIIVDVVRRHVPKVAEFPGGRNFASDENRCRTMVITFQKQRSLGTENPYLFRTYENLHKSDDPIEQKFERNPDLAHDVPISQVARATAAAPTYFKPMIIDGLEYLDGGFGANNPCEEIYDDVKKMTNQAKKCANLILSIGTGKNNGVRRFKGDGISRYLNYWNFAQRWATDSEKTHEKMVKDRGKLAETDKFAYFRLNVEEGLDRMKLDQWRTRHPIRTKIGVCIGKLRSRIGKSNSGRVDPSGISTENGGACTGFRSHATSRNMISGNGAVKSGANSLERAQREPRRHASLQSHPPSMGEEHEKTITGHVDEIAEVLSSNVPKWFQPRNKTIETITKHTEAYLAHQEMRDWIDECAKILVNGRRERAKQNSQRWERTCFRAWYQCKCRGCPHGEKKYSKREELGKHLRNKHQAYDHDELQRLLDGCKTIVY